MSSSIDIGISQDQRQQIADGLGRLLADTWVLYGKTHGFHWNVTGPMFNSLHGMFDTQYNELWDSLDEIAERIRALGMRPGVALNPHTAFALVEPILPELDFVLVMSVNPGFGGQRFIPSTIDKVRALRALMDQSDRPLRLEVDGGVGPGNIAEIAAAGADTFVAGSAIFGGDDYRQTVGALRKALATVS